MAKKKPLKKYQAKNSEVNGIDGIKSAMKTIATTPRSKGYIDFYSEYNPKSLESIPMTMDTTGLASGKPNFNLRSGSGKVITTVDNQQAKALVEKINNGTLQKRTPGSKQGGGPVTAMDKVQNMYKEKLTKGGKK
jgi:hypothetical protein